MNKEFIPYEQALELKELGYNQEFDNDGIWYYATLSSGQIREFCWTSGEDEPYEMYKPIVAPLYQQAFRWFRDEYGLIGLPRRDSSRNYNGWWFEIFEQKVKSDNPTSLDDSDYTNFDTYEEAELACLKKLIEIVKGGDK